MDSVDNEAAWAIRSRRAAVRLARGAAEVHVLPWAQFLYAEGAADRVHGVFSMHDVIVTGCRLDALLADVAGQVVTVLRQPSRPEAFLNAPGPRVSAVEVRRIERNGRA